MKRINLLRALLISLGAVTLAVILVAGVHAGWTFPHAKHGEAAGVTCADCHAPASTSQSGKDDLRPAVEVCINCHTQEDLINYGWVEPAKLSSGFPKFSHEKHLSMEGVDCAHCHGALTDVTLVGTGKGQIGHLVCLECHNGQKAGDECGSCHANIEQIRPLDHSADYLHTHQFLARGLAENCEECHRESTLCSDCHKGENVLFATHDRNYLFTHAEDARKRENDCMACHTQQMCNDCHVEERVKPTNHSSDWTSGTNQHATEALRDIGYCANCHEQDDPVCTVCHRDAHTGKGNDLNIHQDDFDDYDVHGPWHSDDAYFCYDCHNKSQASDGFCGYCHSPDGGEDKR